jgi:hypothetical protein
MTVKWNKEEIKVEENKVDRRKAPIMLYVAPTLMEIEIEDKSFSVFFFCHGSCHIHVAGNNEASRES